MLTPRAHRDRSPTTTLGPALARRLLAWSRRWRPRAAPALVLSAALGLAACGGGEAPADAGKRALTATTALQSSTPAARQLFGATPFQDPADLNGDGKADLLWYDPATGSTVAWHMDGGSLIGGGALLTHPTYRVIGTGDLNGDGRSDTIWYNPAADDTTVWLLDGTRYLAARNLLRGAGFRVIGSPDLNGDGKDDLLWLNPATSTTVAWLMDGVDILASATLLTHPDFRVVAMPDLNGDGKTDLVWRDPKTGQTVAWLMDGTAIGAGVTLLAHPTFKVVATPDLNGDGKSDLVWHDRSTGQTVGWLMDGLSLVAGSDLLSDTAFQVVATPDLNGDGKADLLWHNALTGDTVAWFMDGLTLAGGGTLLRDPRYQPVGASDLNGDGRADLQWYDTANRSTLAWVSNGPAFAGLPLLEGSPYRLTGQHEASVPQPSLGTEQVRMLFAHFHFAGTPPDATPFTVAQTREYVEAGVQPVPAYFNEVSRGRVAITPSYAEPVALTKTRASFQAEDPQGGSVIDDALAILERSGRLNDIDAVVLMLPPLDLGQPTAPAPAGKLTRQINGKPYTLRYAWLAGNNFQAYQKRFMLHEIGHSFGFTDSASVLLADGCEVPSVSLADTLYCSATQIGRFFAASDAYDIMGGYVGYPNLAQLLRVGWIERDQVVTATSTGTHLIAAIDAPSNGLSGIQVPLDSAPPSRGLAYLVEARERPIVLPQNGTQLLPTDQVQIRVVDKAFTDETGQTVPDVSYYFRAANPPTLLSGPFSSYWDSYRGVRFTALPRVSPSRYTVQVEVSALRLSSQQQTGALTVLASNQGTAPIQLSAARLAGRDAAQFSIQADGCSGTSLAQGASCSVRVSLPAEASKRGSLLLDTTDPLRPVAEFSVQP